MLKTYVISLHEPTTLLKQLAGTGLQVELFKGVDGRKLSPDEISKHCTPLWSTFGPKSAIGCGLSHLAVWKAFLKTNNHLALIFEDDVVLTNDFSSGLVRALNYK